MMKRRKKITAIVLLLFLVLSGNSSAYAQTVQYTYDSLGRVTTATYSDGSVYTYQYDKNGNLRSVVKSKDGTKSTTEESTTRITTEKVTNTEQNNSSTEKTTEQNRDTTEKVTEQDKSTTEKITEQDKSMTEKVTEQDKGTTEKVTEQDKDTTESVTEQDKSTTGEKVTEQGESITEEKATEQDKKTTEKVTEQNKSTTEGVTEQNSNTSENTSLTINPTDTKQELKRYNLFKKKQPVIQSLKCIKKNNKYYLKIKVRRVGNKKTGFEIGYQVKYANNEKFKKAKTVQFKRNTKKVYTIDQWKAKKKTYYVKVRAYTKTRTGKKIYTKYSKVKKIKVL